MSELDIVSEVPLTMADVKFRLEAIKKEKKELNFRAEKVLEYANSFVTLKEKEFEDVKKELNDLGIGRLKEKNIAKIIDVMPEDMESLKIIFTSENLTLKQDDLTKILEVTKKHA